MVAGTLLRTEIYDLRTNTLKKTCTSAVDPMDAVRKLTDGNISYVERVTESPDMVYLRALYDSLIILVYERIPNDNDLSS